MRNRHISSISLQTLKAHFPMPKLLKCFKKKKKKSFPPREIEGVFILLYECVFQPFLLGNV